MSNPRHKKLSDLLNKKENAPPDDFEKEALEGFDSLGSEEEAYALKEKLDARMQNEVFSQKRSRRPFVWLAAAALLLLIGLSTWFMLVDGSSVTGQQDLAVVTKKENSEEVTTPAEQSFEAKAAELNPAPETKKTEPSISANDKPREKQAEPAAAAPVALQEPTKQSTGFAVAENERDKDNAVSRTAKSEEQEDARTVNTEAAVSHYKEKMDLARPVAEPPGAAAFESAPPMELKKERARAKKSAGPATSQADMAATPAAATDTLDKTGCYYKGGTTALNKDLEEKLKEKGLNKAFEALLQLDAKKKVSGDITFFKPVNFTGKELKDVEKILRSLDKFDGDRNYPGGTKGYSCIYRVSYKPSN